MIKSATDVIIKKKNPKKKMKHFTKFVCGAKMNCTSLIGRFFRL